MCHSSQCCLEHRIIKNERYNKNFLVMGQEGFAHCCDHITQKCDFFLENLQFWQSAFVSFGSKILQQFNCVCPTVFFGWHTDQQHTAGVHFLVWAAVSSNCFLMPCYKFCRTFWQTNVVCFCGQGCWKMYLPNPQQKAICCQMELEKELYSVIYCSQVLNKVQFTQLACFCDPCH